jgi:membrane-associated phospholipid phosphatase
MTSGDPALPAFARARPFPWIAAVPFVLWPAWLLSRGEVRWELITVMVLVPALAFTRRRLFAGLLPVALVALLYDSMRFVKNVGLSPERVHLCDLRSAEIALFGVSVGGARDGTLHDLIQAHPAPALDALCAVPYGTYIYAVLGAALFLYRRDFHRLQRFTWTFLLLNVAGFVTYHLYPAAPPWYFHAHGCVVDLAAKASAGPNLARVDALLGVGYFRGFYGRSNDIFGAVPSLHVAYPALLALETWPYLTLPLRAVAVAYAALMCVAAVYLDHHWVIDVVVGLAYTAACVALVRLAFRRPAVAP